jgi:UDP-2,4-diacetamido-2,4,6-trideoxy-beta-L-altropyranose hydrolase
VETKFSREISGNLKRVVFFTEGGKDIGLGHVRRCLIIARKLKEQGINVSFVINDDMAAIGWIKREGFNIEISSLNTFSPSLTGREEGCLAFIDTKRQVAEFIRSLMSVKSKVILMDNATAARLEADAVIYPVITYDENLNWNGFKGKIYSGPDYIPIAESFIEAREKRDSRILTPPYKILVTMGGSDPNNLTFKVVSSLVASEELLSIKVVIGPAFTPDPRLKEIADKYAYIEFFRDLNDLSILMADTHVAITAVGTTVYELLYMGVPSIVIANYRTDERDMSNLKNLGIALPLGYHEHVSDMNIRQTVKRLINCFSEWENMSQKGKMLISGYGARNIADIIHNLLLA